MHKYSQSHILVGDTRQKINIDLLENFVAGYNYRFYLALQSHTLSRRRSRGPGHNIILIYGQSKLHCSYRYTRPSPSIGEAIKIYGSCNKICDIGCDQQAHAHVQNMFGALPAGTVHVVLCS